MKDGINLSTLIKAWDQIHIRDTGALGFSDLESALIDAGVEVLNDVIGTVPGERAEGKAARA